MNTGDSDSQDPNEETDAASSIGGWMIVMLWVIVLGAGFYAAQSWLDKRDERRHGVVVNNDGAPGLLLTSDIFGQYTVKGNANGQEAFFLIDTGASGISIPEAVANRLGLRRGRPFEVNTANGTTTVYATNLDTLSIGPLSKRDVRAHINPSMDGEVSLLGMSFLRHFELVHRADELKISAP